MAATSAAPKSFAVSALDSDHPYFNDVRELNSIRDTLSRMWSGGRWRPRGLSAIVRRNPREGIRRLSLCPISPFDGRRVLPSTSCRIHAFGEVVRGASDLHVRGNRDGRSERNESDHPAMAQWREGSGPARRTTTATTRFAHCHAPARGDLSRNSSRQHTASEAVLLVRTMMCFVQGRLIGLAVFPRRAPHERYKCATQMVLVAESAFHGDVT